MLVPTVDSARNRYVLMNCLQHRIHTLSIGVTGTGKTVLINEILSELD
jgi:type IV secretory pathway VirB4 component